MPGHADYPKGYLPPVRSDIHSGVGGFALPISERTKGDDDMYKIKNGSGLWLLLAFVLLSPIATYAQTTVTTRQSDFELIAVDGNTLVVRDQNGTRELTVPPDFRFMVDGKPLAVSDLRAGMKGTATITTTTTVRPV